MEPKILKTEFLEFYKAEYQGKNESGFEPFGDRVLILPDIASNKTSGGVILSEDTVAKQSMAAETGVIVAVGDGAFVWNSDRSRPYQGYRPQPGDRVCFQRYSGQGVFGKDCRHYRLMDDNCIGALEIVE